ncbi:MAG: outer membrane protein assembly factor BamE [Candidatus Omnitrophica bacterium]|nr:outer membrane protein assembly factor BamE [Candidatus Omnitrophota bacterium]MBU4478470.1 outer membrane protein assembly factor BamE [Candidatus Omnitrophota bacterium]MCG2703771.1 outer membrane protein assembly factor BamE [Candidatus Omnitrophota bacterium]
MLEIQKMAEKERIYLFNELDKIKKGMTREEVVEILGYPSRNLLQKVNWWVQPDRKKSEWVFISGMIKLQKLS